MRIIFFLLLLLNLSYANGGKYFIKFGSFKKIHHLKKQVEKLPLKLRSHVLIVYVNGWYVPVAYYTKNKKALSKKLASYRRYFPEASISKSSRILKYPLVKSYQKKSKVTHVKKPKVVSRKNHTLAPKLSYDEELLLANQEQSEPNFSSTHAPVNFKEDALLDTFLPKVKKDSIQNKEVGTTLIVPTVVTENDFAVVEHKQYRDFSKQMLSGQYYYLTYRGTEKNPNLLIRVSFESDEVTYQPVIGDMQMTKANYKVKDGKLYMYSNEFNENGAFSKLEEHRANHFLVSSWMNGKKLNTLRYYYKLNDAKEYLGIETSKGLAEVLEDGDFSEYTWY